MNKELLKPYLSAIRQGLSERAAARSLKLPKTTARERLNKIKQTGNLTHGNTGRQNRRPRQDKQAILDAAAKYAEFSISHICELLESRDGMNVNRETLRRWLARPRAYKKPKQRQRRAASANFGEMLQIDGSFHEWFGDKKTCMINIVDDATGIAELHLDCQETIESACYAAWGWMRAHGVPRSFYADGRNMYHAIGDKQNFFTAMCKSLGIKVILAGSPQAKGRVERYNGVHQKRLVPLMRLDGVREMADAGEYIKGYIVEHNKRFARGASEGNVHRPLPADVETIDDICFMLMDRKVNCDWTFQYNGKVYQIPPQGDHPPMKSTIQIKVTVTGKITAYYKWSVFNVQ